MVGVARSAYDFPCSLGGKGYASEEKESEDEG